MSRTRQLLQKLTGNIRFKHTTFAYPSRPQVKVLNGFSLTVQAGQTVALVGPSGCGKSTIVSFLERFYDANKGGVVSAAARHL